jgi:hypothetical protein
LTGYSWLPTLSTEDDPDAPEYVATRRVIDALGIAVENVDLTVASLRAELERDLSLDGYADLWYEPLVRARARQRGIGVIALRVGRRRGGLVRRRTVTLAELFWRGAWGKLARWLVEPQPPCAQSLATRRGAALSSCGCCRPCRNRSPGCAQRIGARVQRSFSCMAPAFDAAMPPDRLAGWSGGVPAACTPSRCSG